MQGRGPGGGGGSLVGALAPHRPQPLLLLSRDTHVHPGPLTVHGQDPKVPRVTPTLRAIRHQAEAGSPSCLEAGSGKHAPTHHLGAEAAVVELPHESQLPGLRFSEQVLPDPVHGFQVVFQQPVQTSGACVLWPGGHTARSSTNRARPQAAVPVRGPVRPGPASPVGASLTGFWAAPTPVRPVPPSQPPGATGHQPLPA